MSEYDVYYVVNADLYEACLAHKKENDTREDGSNEIEALLPELSRNVMKKCKKLMTILSDGGVIWNKHGVTKQLGQIKEPFNIVDFVLYAVNGNNQPHDFPAFLSFLVSLRVPPVLFCAKIRKQYGKIEKNGL